MTFAATWMDLEIVILSEVSQRKTNIIRYRLYVDSKKTSTNELIYKTKIQSQTQKTNLWGEVGGGINWETGIDIYTLLYIKQITNKDLLQSTGNSTQYSVMTYMGKESKKEWVHVYV